MPSKKGKSEQFVKLWFLCASIAILWSKEGMIFKEAHRFSSSLFWPIGFFQYHFTSREDVWASFSIIWNLALFRAYVYILVKLHYQDQVLRSDWSKSGLGPGFPQADRCSGGIRQVSTVSYQQHNGEGGHWLFLCQKGVFYACPRAVSAQKLTRRINLRGHTLSTNAAGRWGGVKKGSPSAVIMYCLNAVGRGRGGQKRPQNCGHP